MPPTSNQPPLKNLLADSERAEHLKQESLAFKSVTLSRRQLCDLELLLNGGFTPLQGFMDRETHERVCDDMRLPDGTLWPIPITLDVPRAFADALEPGETIALRDPEGFMPAVLTVEEVWRPDKKREAEAVYGTASDEHPGVRYLYNEVNDTCIAGRLEGIQLPLHYDFETLWDTPEELRRLFDKMGWRRILAFHTSNPMHRLHREMLLEQARRYEAHILLHPAVGVTKPGDLHYYARVHCYKAIRHHFPHNLAALSLLPLAMRMAGPREALWHAIVNRNFGCTHFIIGPDHASPPSKRIYGKYDAQEFAKACEGDDLGIEIVPVEGWRYVPAKGQFLPLGQIEAQNLEAVPYSNANLKDALAHNREIPDWFSYPSVIDELRKVYPARSRQGFTLFFTGLSGSGKSTIAGIVFAKLVESGNRPVSLLDGDIVRQNLSSELGFSKEHRDLNIRRIGFVASEITKNGGVAICAPIAPYKETRRAVRELIEQHGAFIEIHVATPLEVCEA
ncbi:MAG TPA: bifunctional sulfate adenylyltransferase/adenylylsulfate kinase, partial [Methylothermaceae bacterium]|nr:bifunctional sulfate adenylyltransferase/adenylylsulfate kinase [Methylothermaceae bacterium]